MMMDYIKCSNNYKSFNTMHIKNNVKYISEDCEILCIPLWHEWFLDSIVIVVKGVEKTISVISCLE